LEILSGRHADLGTFSNLACHLFRELLCSSFAASLRRLRRCRSQRNGSSPAKRSKRLEYQLYWARAWPSLYPSSRRCSWCYHI